MRLLLSIICVLIFAATALCADELLDRMVATVNSHVILLSDLQDEIRFECLSSGQTVAGVTPAQSKAALDRLIDQELVAEQMRAADAKPIPPGQLQAQVQSIKAEILKGNPGRTWDELLSRCQTSQTLVDDRIKKEVEQLQFIDARFRPSIQISPGEIEQYYKEQLVPKLPPADPVSLSDASPKIREILVQEKINQALSSWLETLRSQAQIQFFSAAAEARSSSFLEETR
jgi:hypothetical protein